MKKIKKNWKKVLIVTSTLTAIFIGNNETIANPLPTKYHIFQDSIYFGSAVAQELQKSIVVIHTKDDIIMSCHLSSAKGKAAPEFSAALGLVEAQGVEKAIGDFNINFKNQGVRDSFITDMATAGYALELDHVLPYSISKQRGGTFDNAQVVKVNEPNPENVKDLSIKITRTPTTPEMLSVLTDQWSQKFANIEFTDYSFGQYPSDHIFSRIVGHDEVTIAWNAISTKVSTVGKELRKDGEDPAIIRNAANKFSNAQWRILAQTLAVDNIPDPHLDLNSVDGLEERRVLQNKITEKWQERGYYVDGTIQAERRNQIEEFVQQLYTQMHNDPAFIEYNNSFKIPYTPTQLERQKTINSSNTQLLESYKDVFKILNLSLMGTFDETKTDRNSPESYTNPLIYQGYQGFSVPEGTQKDTDYKQLIEFIKHVLEDAKNTQYTGAKTVNLNIIEATEDNHTQEFYWHCQDLIEHAQNYGIGFALELKLEELLALQVNKVPPRTLLLKENINKIIKNPELYHEVSQELKNNGIILENQIDDKDNSDAHIANLETRDKVLLYLASLSNVEQAKVKDNKNNLFINSALSEEVARSAVANVGARLQHLGIDAGDEDEVKSFVPHGAWISGLYSETRQKSYNNVLSYKSNTAGWTIGVDATIKDEHTVGLAYSRGFSSIAGNKVNLNKVKASSDILSLYGKISLNNNYDIGLVATGNTTRITHQYDKLVGLNSYQLATGKFKSNGFYLQSILNYKLRMNNDLIITPNIGMRYGNQRDESYNESGAGVHNLSVAVKKHQELVGIAGVKISKSFYNGNAQVTPSLMASIENNFSNKARTIKARYLWAESSQESLNIGKAPAVGYNLGTSLVISRNLFEIAADYNCNLKKNYVQHQGVLKLKILF